jgi:hypothetical protein
MTPTTTQEREEIARALLDIQTYGQAQAERLGIRYEDIPALVEEALQNPDPKIVAQAREIASRLTTPYLHEADELRDLSEVELLMRARGASADSTEP